MITTTENGASVNNEVLTTAVSEQATPGLLRNAIDERIVKIRPMATPVDQLSRCAGSLRFRSGDDRYRRYGLGPHQRRPGIHHDTGPGLLLWRHGPQ